MDSLKRLIGDVLGPDDFIFGEVNYFLTGFLLHRFSYMI